MNSRKRNSLIILGIHVDKLAIVLKNKICENTEQSNKNRYLILKYNYLFYLHLIS